MSDCFCTPRYQCLSCERAENKGHLKAAPRRTGVTPNKVAQCGTRAGYNRHRRLSEATCDACRAAQTAAVSKWQRNAKSA